MTTVSHKRYTLYFGALELGTVEEQDADFPNLWGHFHANADVNARVAPHLRDFIAYSVEADRLMQRDEDLWDEYLRKHEERFTDLIESNEWALVASDGTRQPILAPNFCADGGIIWRWNIT